MTGPVLETYGRQGLHQLHRRTPVIPRVGRARDPIHRRARPVPRQNDVGPPFVGSQTCKDHSPRRTEVIGSITSRRIYSRSTVDCGGKRERFVSWRADQWFGRALTLLDGRIDGGGHRLREAARPARPPALRRASRRAQAMPDGSPSVGLAGQGLDRVEGGPRDRGSRHRVAVAAAALSRALDHALPPAHRGPPVRAELEALVTRRAAANPL